MKLLITLIAMGVIGLFGLVDYSYAQTTHTMVFQEGSRHSTCSQIPNGCINPENLTIPLGDSILFYYPYEFAHGEHLTIVIRNASDPYNHKSSWHIDLSDNEGNFTKQYLWTPDYTGVYNVYSNSKITVYGTDLQIPQIPIVNNTAKWTLLDGSTITVNLSELRLNELVYLTTSHTNIKHKVSNEYLHAKVNYHIKITMNGITTQQTLHYNNPTKSSSLGHLLNNDPIIIELRVQHTETADGKTTADHLLEKAIFTTNPNPAPPEPPRTIPNPFEKLEANIETLETQLSDLQTRYNTLKTNYNDLQSRYNNLETQPRLNSTELDQTKSDLSNLQTRYNTLETQYNNLQTQHSSTLSTLSDLQSQYDTLQTKADKLKNKTDLKIERKDLWKERWNTCFENKENIKTQLETTTQELNQYKLDIVNEQNQCTQLLNDHEAQLESYRQQITNHTTTITEKQDEIDQLKQQLLEAENRIRELES